MDFVNLLKNRIDLSRIPFSERGSHSMVFREKQLPGPGERPTSNSSGLVVEERSCSAAGRLDFYTDLCL